MKKSFRHYIGKWYVITGLVIIAAVLLFVFLRGDKVPDYESAVASFGDVTEEVSVTGKVLPVQKAELSFEKGGIISNIAVKVGDKVSRGDLIASLDSAGDAALLDSALAKLDDISRSLRPEERRVEQSRVDSSKIALENARKDALNAIRDGFVKAESVLVNYTDQFFSNPQSANPTINLRVDQASKEAAINRSRLTVTGQIASWKADIDSPEIVKDVPVALSRVRRYVDTMNSFMGELSAIVGDLSTGNSGLSQPVIDAHSKAMNSGLAILNQAIASITSAETSLRNAESSLAEAENNYFLKVAGSSSQSIRAQAATVASFRAELEKDRIVSPIDGIVTRAEPSVGEYVSPGRASFSVQSDGVFKIEANVPEADIAKIAIGNTAQITLDAYGSNVFFAATVASIDPAETVLEGVPTYKVTLHFTEKDDRIRSGMTANTDILTRERRGVLSIPYRAVIDSTKKTGSGSEQGQPQGKMVRILSADGKSFQSVPVVIGLKGSEGIVEIISGLREGDKVVTYLKE